MSAHKQKIKSQLHPRNKHNSRYNLKDLAQTHAELSKYIVINKFGDESIDFFNPDAVKALNKALLLHYYNISTWEIPDNYLCPPIPGRADYIHHISDLLTKSNNDALPKGENIKCLDIGTGASLVYPIIGIEEYKWSFIGSEIDPKSIASVNKIIADNKTLVDKVTIRLQKEAENIFENIIEPNDKIDITICNPPFHASAEEAAKGSLRKIKNLKGIKSEVVSLNFGGQATELWCNGGEENFIRNMIAESKDFAKSCFWFTTIVSKQTNLPGFYKMLEHQQATDVVTIPMGQGNKISRILAWTFLSKNDQTKWKKVNW